MTRREFLKFTAAGAFAAAGGHSLAQAASLTLPPGTTLKVAPGGSIAVEGGAVGGGGNGGGGEPGDIALSVTDLSGFARVNDTVQVAVPFAYADNVTNAALPGVYQSGVAIPCQTKVLSRWGLVSDATAPVRTMLTHFKVASLAASDADATTYAVRSTGQVTSTNMLTDNGTYYTVQTGAQNLAGSLLVEVYKTGTGHNIFKKAQVSDGANWVTMMADANASALYLKGVANSEDANVLTSQALPFTITPGSILILTIGGVDRSHTIIGSSVGEMISELNTAYNGFGVAMRHWPNPIAPGPYPYHIELVAKQPIAGANGSSTDKIAQDAFTFTYKASSTVNWGGDFVPGVAVTSHRRPNNQASDYLSSAYTGGIYAVTVAESGGEHVVLTVAGQFGTSAAPFKGMNDEMSFTAGWAGLGGAGNAIDPQPMSYEADYHFYRQGASGNASGSIVPIEVRWKGGGESYRGNNIEDAAIKNGGLRFVFPFNGSGTKLAIYDSTAVSKASETTWTTGEKYAYQDMAPSGLSNGFHIDQSGFTFTGAPTTLDEGWFVVGASDNSKWAALFHDRVREKSPHGFYYDGTNAELRLWPSHRGHVASEQTFTPRSYHIFKGAWHYCWRGGIMFGTGAYSVPTIRSAYNRFIKFPLTPHCGSKYRTSEALGFIPPGPSSALGTDGKQYKCILEHTATDATKPITGASHATYWSLVTASAPSWVRAWRKGRCYGTLFKNTRFDEAFDRRHRWGTCGWIVGDLSVPSGNFTVSDGTLVGSWNSRNELLAPTATPSYNCYGWTTYGVLLSQRSNSGCMSNGYDAVSRFLNTWMIQGDPEAMDYARIVSEHNFGICVCHDPIHNLDGNGSQWSELTSSTGLQNGEPGCLHGGAGNTDQEFNMTASRSTAYMLTGRAFYYDAALWVLRYRDGDHLGTILTTPNSAAWDNASRATDSSQLFFVGAGTEGPRIEAWTAESFLEIFRMTGSPIALRYARNLIINTLIYTDEQATKASGTAHDEAVALGGLGGLGFPPTRTSLASLGQPSYVWNQSTFTGYHVDAMLDFHRIGTWARAHGYSAQVLAADLVKADVSLIQMARSLYVGTNAANRNYANTPTTRAVLSRPLFRGGYRTGGTVNGFVMPFEYRYSDATPYPAGSDTGKAADVGVAPTWSTAVDGPTCTFTDSTHVVCSAAAPYPFSGGQVFYVASDGPSFAIPIQLGPPWDDDGTVNITLASAYAGNIVGTKNFVVAVGNIGGTSDNMSDSIDGASYSASLLTARGLTAQSALVATAMEEAFIHNYLYGVGVTATWMVTTAETARGYINIGMYSASNERIWGWHTRRGEHYFLKATYEGTL